MDKHDKQKKENQPAEAPDEALFEPAASEASSETIEEAPAAEPMAAGTEDPAADLQARFNEVQDKYLRLMAEFDNFRCRTAREYETRADLACEKIIVDLIEVRDNFERALKAAKQNADAASLLEGMRLIFEKFDAILSKNGLVPFGEVGEPFSPEVHDALMNVHHAEVPADHVADVFERGYRIKNKVVKHGRVTVSSGKQKDAKPGHASDTKEEGTEGQRDQGTEA
jgi:molecular chaperone GrpE